MLARLRAEKGFGLIELLMAITMLNIGILAVVAAFNSGIVTIRRASLASTAASLADAQMELYRSLTYDNIALDATQVSSVDNTYKCDSALGASCPNSTSGDVTKTCGSPLGNECYPTRSVVGPDRHNYRIDTYIVAENPTAQSRQVKRVTVVVRNPNSGNRVLTREASTFDCSTGQPYSSCPTS